MPAVRCQLFWNVSFVPAVRCQPCHATEAAQATEATEARKRSHSSPSNRGEEAFTQFPEYGFSLFLARRTKTIHFVRHAEGMHNEINHAYGDDTPCTHTTPGSWDYMDEVETGVMLKGRQPELEVLAPLTRKLQTAHAMLPIMYPYPSPALNHALPGVLHWCHAERTPARAGSCISLLLNAADGTCHVLCHCQEARTGVMLQGLKPDLVVVSPFTRTLQTAHIMFSSKNLPFIVHDGCRERWGFYTCDKRRTKTEILSEMAPIYKATNDNIDFESFGFEEEEDTKWTLAREPNDSSTARGVELLNWLATRPECEIAVVTHASYLRHLFKAFGFQLAQADREHMQRTSGNAEVRSVTLALHRGIYPEGTWNGRDFVPAHPSFRKGKWAATSTSLQDMHAKLRPMKSKVDEVEELKAKVIALQSELESAKNGNTH
eukprot:gene20297-27055_t